MKRIIEQQGQLLPIAILAFLLALSVELAAQFSLGAGYIPVHQSGQVDFDADQSPIDVFALYQWVDLAIRADYNQTSSYIKDRFSFEQSAFELSLQYSLRRLMGLQKIDPYVRFGASSWNSDFTTEGYPGIQDYELKVETDSGFGLIAGTGVFYSIIPDFAIGAEMQFAINGNAQFIAGGFDPQPLAVDQLRLLLTAKYILFGNGPSGPRGKDANCPKF